MNKQREGKKWKKNYGYGDENRVKKRRKGYGNGIEKWRE